MRRSIIRLGVLVPLVALVLATVVTSSTIAQGVRRNRKPEREDQSDNLYLRRLEGVGEEGLVKPPEYTFRNVSKVSTRAKEWGRVRLTYSTMPEWADEIQVDYHVLLKSSEREREDKPPFMLLEGNITYIDVEKGEHVSEAFLHPNTIERYGEIVAVAAEMRYEGENVMLSENSKTKAPVKGKWWVELRDNPKVISRDGYVLNRNHTPFVLANHSAYEPIRE
jgi:hypothetical protein